MVIEVARHLAGVVQILATQIAVLATLLGVGLLLHRAVAVRPLSICLLPICVWTGLAVTLCLLMLWNFAFAVDGTTWALLVPLGLAGIYAERGPLAMVIRRGFETRKRWILVLLFLGWWEANLCLDTLREWDSTLYHMQAVRWAAEYPVIPGLANLYGPLAYNNSSFLFDALLDVGPWNSRSFHLANGSIALVLCVQWVIAIGSLVRADRPPAWAVFESVFLVFVMDEAIAGNLTSYGTSFPSNSLLLVGIACAIRLVSGGRHEPADRRFFLLSGTLVFAAAVTIKMSVAMLVILIFLLLLAVGECAARGDSYNRRSAALATLLAVGFGLVWSIRGIVMSGYPFFPLPIFGMPVDWLAPLEHARAEMAHIGFSEREFAWETGEHWLRHVRAVPFRVLVPVGVSAVAAIGTLNRWRRGAASQVADSKRIALFAAPPVIAGLVWLLSAPSTRYAVAIFWSLAGIGLAAWAVALGRHGRRFAAAAVLLAVAAALSPGLSPARDDLSRTTAASPPSRIEAIAKAHLNRAGEDGFLHRPPPIPKVHPYRSDFGAVVNVPLQRCYNAPLPCTPNPAANLQLRRDGDLSGGFRVGPNWQMRDFPQPWRPDWVEEWRARRGD